MDKKEFKKKAYVKPAVEAVEVKADSRILAGSPAVQPGGGGGGSVSIEDPVEDDEDTEISGAKKFNLWEGGDD